MSDEDYIKKLEDRVEYLKSDIDNNGICLPTLKLTTYHKHGLLILFILFLLVCSRPYPLYSNYFDKDKLIYVEYFCWSKLFVATFMIYIIIISSYCYMEQLSIEK